MLGFARGVVAFIRGRKREDLDSDRAFLRSLERSLELVGECARRISGGTREANPSISWRDMIGMRNIIAHEYGSVDRDELWKTANRDAPLLVSNLEAIVATLPPPR
ncbi:MAG TPA: HepT-like ribonuclease domain-containing protein [Reyranella sp.]|nr:HepT-like ribonuclease domain-containing protein [Reyranella sp.]